MPLFALIIVSVAYLECTKKSIAQDADQTNGFNLETLNLKYMMYSGVILCIPASGAMIYFQLRSFFGKKHVWCYNYPYYLLWVSIILYIYAAKKLVDKVERDNNHDRLTNFKPWKEGLLLWIVNIHDSATFVLAFSVCRVWFCFTPTKSLRLYHGYNCHCSLFTYTGDNNHKTYMYYKL